jgi:hypothetical protein
MISSGADIIVWNRDERALQLSSNTATLLRPTEIDPHPMDQEKTPEEATPPPAAAGEREQNIGDNLLAEEEGDEQEQEEEEDLVHEQRREDEDFHETAEEHASFHLASPLNPLGGSSYHIPEAEAAAPHEPWNFNLGMVANLASSQLSKATAVAGSILPLNFYRRKSFSLSFQSKSIPFEFMTSPDGYVIVSHVSSKALLDPRLHRGVIILGVNDVLVNVQQNASEEMEKLLESAQVPFSVTFQEVHEGGDDIAEYEEESTGTKTDSSVDEQDLDDEEHAGMTTPQEQHDDSETFSRDQKGKPSSLASVASTSASLFSSSLFSLTNKVKALVTPIEQHLSAHASTGAVSAPPSAPSSAAPSPLSHEYHQLPDNSFELILSGRSPPFVFDLHADGISIVVVKILGDRKSVDPRLQEGCVVRYANDIEVKCRSRQEFDQLLSSIEETPLRLILEHAPALYRHQDALSLYTSGQQEQAVHVFTVMPNSFTVPSPTHSHPHQVSVSYDDVYHTSHRALQVLQAFRAQGIPVELISMETVLVGTNSAYSGILNTLPPPSHSDAPSSSAAAFSNTIANNLASMMPTHVPLLRASRVWFRFPDALQIVIQSPSSFVGSLEVTKSGGNGSWIVIRCIVSQSPWIEEGMILGRPYLVTQVNGYDTSASGYRSINPRVPGTGEWESSILPFFEYEEINLTIV